MDRSGRKGCKITPALIVIAVCVFMLMDPSGKPVISSPQSPQKVDCKTVEFGCARIPAGQHIKIGMGAPMTGDMKDYGIDASQAASIAIQDGGNIGGFHFELVTRNDEGTPAGGAAVANSFINDSSVVAIAGHIFSGPTAAAIPIYESAGIPMMSPSASRPELTQPGSRVFNRVIYTDAAQARFAAQYIFYTLGQRRIAVMSDNQAYSIGLANGVAARFEEIGGVVVDHVEITPGETDYSAPLSSIAAKKPGLLYYGGFFQEAAVLVTQMPQSGLQGVIFFGCDGTYGAEFISRGGVYAEGAYAVSPIPPPSAAVDAFNNTYKTQYGKAPGSLSLYTWNAYDAAAALIVAIKQVAYKDTDGSLVVPRAALIAAVRGLRNYQGLTGTITCASNGECNASGPVFYVVREGAWVIPRWYKAFLPGVSRK